MARVLSVLPGNNAIVSTENLFRIFVCEGKRRRINGELVEMDEGAETVKQLRRCRVAADAVPYQSLAVRERDEAWKFQYEHCYPQVLAIVPRCVVISSLGWYRVADQSGVPIHEFCDMDSAYNLARPDGTIFGKVKRGKVLSYDELAADRKTPALCYREAVS